MSEPQRIPNDQAVDLSFEQLEALPRGAILWEEEIRGGGRFMIRRDGFGLCGYVGIPRSHPRRQKLKSLVAVHFGIDFTEYGDGKSLDANFYWCGWEYGHLVDWEHPLPEDVQHKNSRLERLSNRRRWTVLDILEDARPALQILEGVLAAPAGREG